MARRTLRSLILTVLAIGLGGVGVASMRIERPAEVPRRTAAPQASLLLERAMEGDPSVAAAEVSTTAPSGRFNVAPEDGGVTVTLPEAGGITPRLTLSLDEIRVGGVLIAAGGVAPRLEEGQGIFQYDRGTVRERYTVRPLEMEQDFVISTLPSRGDLVVTETIVTNAALPSAGSPAPSVELPCGPVSFVISRAVAIDAAGRRLPLDLELSGGRLRMTVPASWIETAALPIVVDPVVGGQILVVMPQGIQNQDLAGGPNGWVATWGDGFNTSWNVYARPISATGVPGTQVTVNSVTNGSTPSIAYSAPLNKYLIVWIESNISGMTEVSGRFLDGAGALSGSKFRVGYYTTTGSTSAAVAADSSGGFLVVVQYNQQVDGALVNSSGSVTSRPSIQTTQAWNPAKVAFSNGEYLVAWLEGGATLRARGLSSAGALLTPVTTISNGTWCNLSAISGGAGQFLLTWWEGTTPVALGRVIKADSAATLGFASGPITISTTGSSTLPVWSGPSSVWMVVLWEQGSLQAVTMSPLGAISAKTLIVPPSVHYTSAAGVTTANDALVMFVPDPTPSFPSPRILAQRYNIGTVALPPPAPKNLAAVGKVGSVGLSWAASTGATSYKIYRTQTPGLWPATPQATVTGTTATDSTVTNNQWYYYMVRASSGAGDSANSNSVAVEPLSAPLPAPGGVAATALNGAVQISWAAVPGAISYSVARTTEAGVYTSETGCVGIAASPITDIDLINGTRYFYRVCAVGPGGSGDWSLEVSAVPQMPSTLLQVLFVASSTTLTAADSTLKTRLTNMGYSVIVVAAPTAVTADASGKALVVISSTVTSADVNTKFRTVAVPVIAWENAVLDDLGMTGTVGGTDYGTTATAQTQISILNSGHPLAAGLSSTVSVSTTANSLCWGKPGAAAVTIATPVGDPGKAVIFGYDTNAAMPGLPAPARRVGLFLTDVTASTLTAQGKSLFDAAVRWATGADSVALPPTKQVNVTRASGGMLRVSWDPVPGAACYVILRATSASGPFTVVATGVTSLDWYDTPPSSTASYFFQVEPVNAAGGIGAPVANEQAAPPTTGNYFNMAITGRRYIRAYRSSFVAPDDSNRSDYRANVYEHSQDGTTLREVVTGVTGTWGLMPTDGGKHAPVTFTKFDLQSTVQATTVENDLNDSSGYYLYFSGSINGQFIYQRVYIEVTQRRNVKIMFRFPEDAAGQRGQTCRKWGAGDPNLFFSGDDNLRQQARVQFATDFYKKVFPVIQSAGIGLYLAVDIDRLKINGFDATTGIFVAQDRKSKNTKVWDELVVKDLPGYINIYLVEQLEGGGVVLGGITRPDPLPGGRAWIGNHFMLADIGTPVTLAHELGHCMGLNDVILWSQVSGDLNNLKDVSGGKYLDDLEEENILNPLNWCLMRQQGSGRLTDTRGWLLTDWMSRKAFTQAATHPRRTNPD